MHRRHHKSAAPVAPAPVAPARTESANAVASSTAPTVPATAQPTTTTSSPVANNGHDGKVSEEAVRVCAYYKWEQAGKPNEDGIRFWIEAESELK